MEHTPIIEFTEADLKLITEVLHKADIVEAVKTLIEFCREREKQRKGRGVHYLNETMGLPNFPEKTYNAMKGAVENYDTPYEITVA